MGDLFGGPPDWKQHARHFIELFVVSAVFIL